MSVLTAEQRIDPITECLKFYAKHAPDCSGAEIACACGLSQLRHKAFRELADLQRLAASEALSKLACHEHFNPQCPLCMATSENVQRLESQIIHWRKRAAERQLDELREPMACGHPRACLYPGFSPAPSTRSDVFCTSCERENEKVAQAEQLGRLQAAKYIDGMLAETVEDFDAWTKAISNYIAELKEAAEARKGQG